jgi:hypothetical protein
MVTVLIFPGIAGVSYLVGAVLDAVLLALFKGRGGGERR